MIRNTTSLLVLCLLAACASSGDDAGSGPTAGSGAGPEGPGASTTETGVDPIPAPEFAGPAPEDPPEIYSEDPTERARRTALLEAAGDRWAEANLQQRYATRESMEAAMRTFSRDYFDQIVSDLRNGPMRNQRIAAWALGFSGSADAVDPLLASLDSPFPDVTLHALLSLHHLLRPMRGGSPTQMTSSQDMPGGANFEADEVTVDIQRIVPLLQHADPRIRSNAGLVLLHAIEPGKTEVSDEVFLALVSAKNDPDAATRVHVVGAMGRTMQRAAIPHLVRSLLDDQVPLVRIRAAFALGRVGDPAVAPSLIEALRRPGQDEQVKKYVAAILSKLLDERGLRSTRAEDWVPVARARGVL